MLKHKGSIATTLPQVLGCTTSSLIHIFIQQRLAFHPDVNMAVLLWQINLATTSSLIAAFFINQTPMDENLALQKCA